MLVALCSCGGSTPPDVDIQALTDAFESSHLALVLFETGGTPIPDEPKILARMIVIDDGGVNRLDSGTFHYDGNIGIELRGHSSLVYPKKQFAVETRDDEGEDQDVALLGFPEEEDWVFYAPYADKTMLRNWFVYGLGAELGAYAPRTRFVEVFVDGQYWGVYLFTEKIKRDKNRVAITKLDDEDNAEPEITGGYLLEMTDVRTLGDKFVGSGRALFEVKDPKADKVTDAQIIWIRAYLQKFESVLYGGNFEDPDIGWRAYADEDSFIDYVLIQEFVKNSDAFQRSTFFSKDRSGPLRAGPLWDFNIAMGNVPNAQTEHDPEGFLLRGDAVWAGQLLLDRAFVTRLIARWRELRNGPLATDRLMARIDEGVAALGDAVGRNFERWPVLGQWVWPNPTPLPRTYEGEIDVLKAWLTARARWLDDNIDTIR